jgi:hypothetical protein
VRRSNIIIGELHEDCWLLAAGCSGIIQFQCSCCLFIFITLQSCSPHCLLFTFSNGYIWISPIYIFFSSLFSVTIKLNHPLTCDVMMCAIGFSHAQNSSFFFPHILLTLILSSLFSSFFSHQNRLHWNDAKLNFCSHLVDILFFCILKWFTLNMQWKIHRPLLIFYSLKILSSEHSTIPFRKMSKNRFT